jgi:putative ubiquitin-RnfH superfamily antitoxin RatB of RatAB toxin-antitoxin module
MGDDADATKNIISVEVAYATTEKQLIVALEVPTGTTVHEAIAMSKIADEFPRIDLHTNPVGIFSRLLDGKGRPTAQDYVLQSGDRIEIYRPLVIDPKQARLERARAAAEKTKAIPATKSASAGISKAKGQENQL